MTNANVTETIDISAIRYLNKHYFNKIKTESLKERAVFNDLRDEIINSGIKVVFVQILVI